jgi:hypothetical protein
MSYHINTTQILVPRNITNFVKNVTALTCPIEVPVDHYYITISIQHNILLFKNRYKYKMSVSIMNYQ